MSYEHYSRVYASIWIEPWTEDMRMLAFYLLTGPHRRSEGLYRLPLSYAAADLQWLESRLHTALDALKKEDFVEYDEGAQIVLVLNALKRNGLNDKQIIGVVKAVRDLPPTPLYDRFESLSKEFNKKLAKALAKATPRNGATVSI